MNYSNARLWAVTFFCALATALTAQDAPTAASLYNEGLASLKAKDYAKGYELMQKAIEAAKPDDENDQKVIRLAKGNGAIAAYYVGTDQRKNGQLDDALATFEKGIELNPNQFTNYTGKALVMEDKGQTAAAVEGFLMAAEVAEKGKKPDKAEEYIKKAENYAAVAWGKKQWDDAIAAADAVLAKKESADAYYYKGAALKEKGKASDAIELVEKAITLLAEGEDASKHNFLIGECHESAGNKAAAIEAFKKVTDAKYKEVAKYKIDNLGS